MVPMDIATPFIPGQNDPYQITTLAGAWFRWARVGTRDEAVRALAFASPKPLALPHDTSVRCQAFGAIFRVSSLSLATVGGLLSRASAKFRIGALLSAGPFVALLGAFSVLLEGSLARNVLTT